MHISEAQEFIAAALDNNQIQFDDNGVCEIDAGNGIVTFLVFAPPTLRIYCRPFFEDEYDDIEDKAAFLESLLAINYESDVGSRQAFKMGFHQALGEPIVAAEMDTGDMQAEILRTICDDLHMIAGVVRETVVGDGFAEEEDEDLDIPEDEPSAFDGSSLRL